MNAPAFVTVNTCGLPCAHDNAAGAIETHLRDVGGAWNLFGHQRPGIEKDLATKGESNFFHHHPDSSPYAAAVFENRARRDLAAFTNDHLLQLPKSRAYLEAAAVAWLERPGPRVGDYVRDSSGALSRFTYDTGDGLQAGGGRGSYHLGMSGHASYSGSLTASIPRARLIETADTGPGEFWFFLDGWAGAHRGISAQLTCRFFLEVDA